MNYIVDRKERERDAEYMAEMQSVADRAKDQIAKITRDLLQAEKEAQDGNTAEAFLDAVEHLDEAAGRLQDIIDGDWGRYRG